jgi:hypothetical protein
MQEAGQVLVSRAPDYPFDARTDSSDTLPSAWLAVPSICRSQRQA